MARRALVTGATGYLGSRLTCRLVAEGWDVHVLNRPGSSLGLLSACMGSVHGHIYDGSLASIQSAVAAARPEVVFHLGSLFLVDHVPADVDALLASNIQFPVHLLQSMSDHGVRQLVNTGTSWQHYEDEAYRPVNLYAATKQAFEDLLAFFVDTGRLQAITLCLYDTYGDGDPRRKVVPLLWRTALSGEPLSMSPGEQLIDLVHVDDVLEAYLVAASRVESLAPQTRERFGVGSGSPVSLRELASTFERATGLSLRIEWGGRPYRAREVMVPARTALVPLPGWQPRIDLLDGLPRSRPIGA